MLLREVRRLVERGPSTLSQIAAELGAGQEIVRQALRFWVDRGDMVVSGGMRVTMHEDADTVSCSSSSACSACAPRPQGIGPALYTIRHDADGE